MRVAILTLTAILASPPVFAQQPAPPAQQGQTSDPKKEDSEHMKGYGYGTPSGVESNGSAGQAVQRKRAKSKTPQQEERTPAAKQKKKGKKVRGAAHAPSQPGAPGGAASAAPPRQ